MDYSNNNRKRCTGMKYLSFVESFCFILMLSYSSATSYSEQFVSAKKADPEHEGEGLSEVL